MVALKRQLGFTLGKKALTAGYKRYGIPGAIATGSAAALGYAIVRGALRSKTGRENVSSAIDVSELRTQVGQKGLAAVTNRETLESAIDEDELDGNVRIEDVQSEAEAQADELDDEVPDEDIDDAGETSGESTAASSDASGSTGSITEEGNDSPSAAEPAEAAGPSGGDDVRPETEDGSDEDDS